MKIDWAVTIVAQAALAAVCCLSASAAMAENATTAANVSESLTGKWCFDDNARKLLQRTINISLPQRLPAQEFEEQAGAWHMYMDPAPFPGLPKGTTRLFIANAQVSIEPDGTVKIVQATAPWKELAPSSLPEGVGETEFFTVSFFQGQIAGLTGQRQLVFEVQLRSDGKDKLVVPEISLAFDGRNTETYPIDGGPLHLSRC
jgi:hypothetical protein